MIRTIAIVSSFLKDGYSLQGSVPFGALKLRLQIITFNSRRRIKVLIVIYEIIIDMTNKKDFHFICF